MIDNDIGQGNTQGGVRGHGRQSKPPKPDQTLGESSFNKEIADKMAWLPAQFNSWVDNNNLVKLQKYFLVHVKMMISFDEIILPNKPLINLDIIASGKKLRIPAFRRVFARDELPSKPNRNEGGILVLDDSCGNATHWTT